MPKFFTDKNGEVRGWRIAAVFAVLFGWFAYHMVIRTKVSPDMQVAIVVLAVLFALGAIGTWVVDALQRRRTRQMERAGASSIPSWLFAQPNKRSRSVTAGLCGMVLIPTFLTLIAPKFFEEWQSLTWREVESESLGVDVRQAFNGFEVVTRLAFVNAGERHVIALSAHGMSTVRRPSEARRLEMAFAPGTTHRLFIHPEDVTRASLQRGPSVGVIIGTITLPILGVGVFVISLQAVASGLRSHPPTNLAHGALNSGAKRAA